MGLHREGEWGLAIGRSRVAVRTEHCPGALASGGRHGDHHFRCEREMCPWAISKYFGDLVSNTSA
jgi:hypothetical protein